MIEETLGRVTSGTVLSRGEMRELIREVMSGSVEPLVVAALLAALRTRGEARDEIVGAAEAIRELCVAVPAAPAGAVDTCGTGGDGSNTFNISTVAAIVVAGAGVPVAKHGNRAASSLCGSAEVLEALGIRLDLPPAVAARSIAEVGIGFLYARACHPSFAAVGPIRGALKIPTIFNRLGPLTNPTKVRRHLVGVGRPELLEDAVHALAELGAERAWVAHGEDGLDEISIGAPTRILTYVDGKFDAFTLAPGELVPSADVDALRGGDAQANAEIARAVLSGEPGPRRDVVLLNAAAALVVAAHPAAKTLGDGLDVARESIDSGAAREKLARWAAFTRDRAAEEGLA